MIITLAVFTLSGFLFPCQTLSPSSFQEEALQSYDKGTWPSRILLTDASAKKTKRILREPGIGPYHRQALLYLRACQLRGRSSEVLHLLRAANAAGPYEVS